MNKIFRKLEEIYIFFLPITIFGLTYPFNHGGIFSGISAYVMVVNLVLLVLLNPKKLLLKIIKSPYTALVFSYFIFMSLFMSNIIYIRFGIVRNHTSYTAVLRQIIFLVHIYITIIYNKIIIEDLKLERIFAIIRKSLFYLVSFTLLELVVINFYSDSQIKSIFVFVEKYINPVGMSTDKLIDIKKMKSLTEEPSMLGAVFSIYVLPFFLYINSNFTKIKKMIYIVLSCIILIYSKASTSMIGVILISIYIFFQNFKKLWKYSIFIIIIFLMNFTMIIKVFSPLYSKVFELKNLSSVHRYSSVYTNIKGFLDYPIFGFGWGNSGFFYLEYFPKWGFTSEESLAIYYGKKLPFTGGGITVEYITSFGIIGVIILLFILIINLKKLKNTPLNNYLKLSIFLIIVLGVVSIEITGRYYAIFLITLLLESDYINKNINSISK
ncbi:O-antigen ligase family protein [Cetobacterium somerae]